MRSRFNVTDIRAVLGEHDMVNKTETVTVERKLVKAEMYANFSILTFNNDIAVLELESAVELGTAVRPACLPADGKLLQGAQRDWCPHGLLVYIFFLYSFS
jgi:hypothetical protein